MVIDNLKNAPYYYGCHPKIDLILRYLKSDRKGLVQPHRTPGAAPGTDRGGNFYENCGV